MGQQTPRFPASQDSWRQGGRSKVPGVASQGLHSPCRRQRAQVMGRGTEAEEVVPLQIFKQRNDSSWSFETWPSQDLKQT